MKQLCVIPQELNFTFAEFFKSDYAKQLDINNVTSDPKILTAIMTTICCLLQPLRMLCNMFDIDVTNNLDPYKDYSLVKRAIIETKGLNIISGWRSPTLIEKCKKVLNITMSKTGHPDGECADIKRAPWTNLKLFCVIKALHKAGYVEFDQLIYEYDTNCCHIGYRGKRNRNQIMIRKLVNKKLVYYNV